MYTEIMFFLTMCSTALGFVLGKYHERVEWNKLIQAGRIPKPFWMGH